MWRYAAAMAMPLPGSTRAALADRLAPRGRANTGSGAMPGTSSSTGSNATSSVMGTRDLVRLHLALLGLPGGGREAGQQLGAVVAMSSVMALGHIHPESYDVGGAELCWVSQHIAGLVRSAVLL